MNFLKKLGTVFLKVAGLANGFLPLFANAANVIAPGSGTTVSNVASTALDKLNQALGAIVTVEQVFAHAYGPDAQKGSDKLAAATPYVAQLIQQTDLLIGKHPKDETLFKDASTRLTGAIADILRSYGE